MHTGLITLLVATVYLKNNTLYAATQYKTNNENRQATIQLATLPTHAEDIHCKELNECNEHSFTAHNIFNWRDIIRQINTKQRQ